MPTYYDDNSKTLFCKFYYTDEKGNKKQKKKRGFKLQREAKEFERSFLEKQSNSINMSFNNFLHLYQEDINHRLKPKTLVVKNSIIEKHILPFFKDMRMDEITAVTIRKWQNELISKNYSDAYLKKVNGILNAIFNYAAKFYDLKDNPCTKAGSIGSHKSKEMVIYTLDQFKLLLEHAYDYTDYTIFSILFFTGMRKGELFALQRKDIDLENGIINIDKSYQRIAKEDVYTSPKTPNSVRKVEIPKFLTEIIKQYLDTYYHLKKDDYVFTHHYVKLRGRLKIAQRRAGLTKNFTIHCFRHSHVSLLIELGYSILMIADRIGDTVETTLKTYSHLYPDKQSQLVNQLDKINNSTKLVPEHHIEKKKP